MNQICAIVVTYHPKAEVARHIEALQAQAAEVVVIDNGSLNDWVADLRDVCNRPNTVLFCNAQNLGIATAFNQGIKYALDKGYKWIATFDQDSEICHQYFERLVKKWAEYPERERVAVIAPLHDLSGKLIPKEVTRELPARKIMVTMASGNLLSSQAVRCAGGMDEKFFIDYVDFEYCLRLRRNGWHVIQANDVMLHHKLGQQDDHNFLGIRFSLVSHSSLRRYYITRNRLITYRRHGWRFPAWLIKDMAWWSLEMLKLLCFETGKREKLRSLWLGLRDAYRGRLGPAPAEVQSRPHAAPART